MSKLSVLFSGFTGSLIGALIAVGAAYWMDHRTAERNAGIRSAEIARLQSEVSAAAEREAEQRAILVCTELSVNLQMAENLLAPNLRVLRSESGKGQWINLARLSDTATVHALGSATSTRLHDSREELVRTLAAVREVNYTADKVAFGEFSSREGCEFTRRLHKAAQLLQSAHGQLKCTGSWPKLPKTFPYQCE